MLKKFREFVVESFKSPDETHSTHVQNAEEARKKADAAGDKPHEFHSHMADHFDHLHKACKHMLTNHPHHDEKVTAIQRHIADQHARKARIHRELADEHKNDKLNESASKGTFRDQIKAHIHNEWKQDTLSGYGRAEKGSPEEKEDHDDLEHETSKAHAHALKHKITDPKKAYDHYTDHAYGHITKAIEKVHADNQAKKKKMH